MLQLISSPTSPFARKVRIVLAEKNIEYRLVDQSPWTDADAVHAHNPLGKVPVLVLDDGTAIFDSRVIVDYLDDLGPVSRVIPSDAQARWIVRRWEALADGVCDAALSIVLERRRPPEQQSESSIERQKRKMHEGVAALARELGERPWCHGDACSLADIATACALGYLDLRHADFAWRERFPNLARLAERLDARPSFKAASA